MSWPINLNLTKLAMVQEVLPGKLQVVGFNHQNLQRSPYKLQYMLWIMNIKFMIRLLLLISHAFCAFS